MADRFIQDTTLQGIANALRGGESTSESDKIDVTDFATKASGTLNGLKGLIDRTLTSVEIPSSVTSIGTYAFQGCTSLTSVEIPSSVTSIGTFAFQSCTSLTSIEIPSSVTSIGTYAFGSIKSDAVINCGFAQGAVSGAPWGAPAGVTINYGVTNGAKGKKNATSSVIVTDEMVAEYKASLPKEEELKK